MCAAPGRSPSQTRIAKLAGVDQSTVARILNKDPRARVRPDTRARVLVVARRLGYDFSQIRRIHRRASERVRVDLPVRISIRSRGAVHTQGTARVRTLNAAGLLLEEFRCHPDTLPLAPFSIRVEFVGGGFEEITTTCEPVHLSSGRSFAIGAKFVRLPSKVREQLLRRSRTETRAREGGRP